MTNTDILQLGWTEQRQHHRDEIEDRAVLGELGRVSFVSRDRATVITEQGPVSAIFLANLAAEPPTVGDFVELAGDGELLRVMYVHPRQSTLTRQAAGRRAQQQVLASNIDRIFIVTSANMEFNLRRLERMLVAAWDSGASPVVVLNKTDLVDDPDRLVSRAESVAAGVPVVAVSALADGGLVDLEGHLAPGRTVVLLGSSGVGKSTITNALMGRDEQVVRSIREDDHEGRHTTVGRHLFVLPHDRGLLIDTPGIRELQLWAGDGGIALAFEDIEELASACRFRDCDHQGEPGCAVLAAIDEGAIQAARLDSYHHLKREQAYQARRADVAGNRRRNKAFGKMARRAQKLKRR